VENRKKLKIKKTDVLRSIAKQPGESMEEEKKEVRKKKKKATVGRICRKKENFKPGFKHHLSVWYLSIWHRGL